MGEDVFDWVETPPEGEVVDAEFEVEEDEIPEVQAPPPAVLDAQPVAVLVNQFKTQCELALQRAKGITSVRDEETNLTAVKWASQSKKLYKRLEDLRKEIVGPYNAFVTQVNAFFKVYTEPLFNAEKYLAKQVGAYRQFLENEARRIKAEQEAEARKLQAKLEAEAKAAAKEDVHYEPAPIVAPVVVDIPKVTRTTEGSASQRKDWTFEIVDESLVEREFLMVNEKKIREHIKGGLRNSPGLRIFEQFTTRIRA